jgi:hypothetical protein
MDRAGCASDPAPDAAAPTRRHDVPEVIRVFESCAARAIDAQRGASGVPVRRRGHPEHVVRGDAPMERIRTCIRGNPVRWCRQRAGDVRDRARTNPAAPSRP